MTKMSHSMSIVQELEQVITSVTSFMTQQHLAQHMAHGIGSHGMQIAFLQIIMLH